MTATHAAQAALQEIGRDMGRGLAVAFHSAGALTNEEMRNLEAAITRGRDLWSASRR